jgi:hypothetical protein
MSNSTNNPNNYYIFRHYRGRVLLQSLGVGPCPDERTAVLELGKNMPDGMFQAGDQLIAVRTIATGLYGFVVGCCEDAQHNSEMANRFAHPN